MAAPLASPIVWTWLRFSLVGLLLVAAVAVVFARRRWRLPVVRLGVSRQAALTGTVLRWLVLALLVAAGSGAALLWSFGWPDLPSTSAFDTGQLLDLLRIVLTVVAGLGGVVLLAVNTRKQRVTEAEHGLAAQRAERERVQGFNERFGTAAEQLAHESAAVRLAGVYAMAGLADDWIDQRQVCVDVLCGYLRVQTAGDDHVREAILRVIRDRVGASTWQELDFDFTGMDFEDADFGGLRFDGTVVFDGVLFSGELTSFRGAKFRGTLSCHGTFFQANTTTFAGTRFTRARVEFVGAEFTGTVLDFSAAELAGHVVDFYRCSFALDRLNFSQLDLENGDLRFDGCEFTGTELDFSQLNDYVLVELPAFPRLTIEDCRLTRCVLDLRWGGERERLWWLADCRLEQVEFRTGYPEDRIRAWFKADGRPWLNVRDLELIETELPERYVRRPKV